jgi:hypothetical protein
MSAHDIIMGAAGAAGGAVNYIEDVFSTYLYTGNGSTQTITNGIDLSTKGGLVWIKSRSSGVEYHNLFDTARGAANVLFSNTTDASASSPTRLSSFNTTGFTVGSNAATNASSATLASWSFRKQPKFFDVVTYTGNGSDPRNIAHSLGSVPGCIIIKCTSTGATDWFVYHRSLGNTQSLNLNQTGAAETGTAIWGSTTPTSTVFTVGNINANTNGRTYVAYLFAHDAGGFGLTGTDNVISCGSYTGNGSSSGPTITLGYEPQWLMVKKTSNATNSNWFIVDNMRGFTADGSDTTLYPNLSNAEGLFNPAIAPTATGFQILNTGSTYNESGSTYIYIAIRRGPMKVPTDATKVFAPAYYASGLATGTKSTTNFPVDLQMVRYTPGTSVVNSSFADRLRGVSSNSTASGPYLVTSSTAAETTNSSLGWDNTGFLRSPNFGAADPAVYHSFQRAPGFFDEVCYTGTGTNTTQAHNLGVAPELMILRQRGGSGSSWYVYAKTLGPTNTATLFLEANYYAGQFFYTTNPLNNTNPTSSVFTLSSGVDLNNSGQTYVAYLFATCAGVSKVGSYTGNGSSQTINCGFTAGARFVLIKRTDSTGDWYVWDTARGMVAGTDPYLLLDSTAAEVNANYIYTTTGGFQIVTTTAAINASGGSYIYLAIA